MRPAVQHGSKTVTMLLLLHVLFAVFGPSTRVRNRLTAQQKKKNVGPTCSKRVKGLSGCQARDASGPSTPDKNAFSIVCSSFEATHAARLAGPTKRTFCGGVALSRHIRRNAHRKKKEGNERRADEKRQKKNKSWQREEQIKNSTARHTNTFGGRSIY